MYELYFQNFNSKVPVPLTAEEQALVAGYLTVKKIRKRQYLLQEGDVCKAVAFVEQGALRAYTLGADSNEHIIQFALEGWLISDISSFLTGEPGTYAIDAIEDTQVLLMSRAATDELAARLPKFQAYMYQLMTKAYIALQKRLKAAISLSPDERYTGLLASYPSIAQRVPQRMLASYLGLTPETLSRVRRRLGTRP